MKTHSPINIILPVFRWGLFCFLGFLVLAGPISQLYRTLHQEPYSYRYSPIMKNGPLGKYLFENSFAIQEFVARHELKIHGGPYAVQIFGYHFSEPLSVTLSFFDILFQKIPWNRVLIFTFISCGLIFIFFGRVYCGYICPMSTLTSINLTLQKVLFGRNPTYSGSPINPSLTKKICLWGSLLLIVIFPSLLPLIHPASLIQNGVGHWVLFGTMGLGIILPLFLIGLEITLPAFFCRMLCPTGNFLTLWGHLRPFSLERELKIPCLKGCSHCLEACWLKLNPKSQNQDPACDLCLRCVGVCPVKKLSFPKILMIIFFLSFTRSSEPLNWDTLPTGGDHYYGFTLVENEKSIPGSITRGNTFIRYSIVSEPGILIQNATATFNCYIEIRGESYQGPLSIIYKQGDAPLKTHFFEEPNFPISIRKRSVYSAEFFYTHGEHLTFWIKNLEEHSREELILKYDKTNSFIPRR